MKKTIFHLLFLIFLIPCTVNAQELLFDAVARGNTFSKFAGTANYTLSLGGNTVQDGNLIITAGSNAVGITLSPAISTYAGGGVTVVMLVSDVDVSVTGQLVSLRTSQTTGQGGLKIKSGTTDGTLHATWADGEWASGAISQGKFPTDRGKHVVSYGYIRNGEDGGNGSAFYINENFITNFTGLQSASSVAEVALGGISTASSTFLNTGMKIHRVQLYKGQLTAAQVAIANQNIRSLVMFASVNNSLYGSVTVDGETSPHSVSEGVPVVFEATANHGYRFVNWTDNSGNEVSTENPYTVASAEKSLALTANFTEKAEPTVVTLDVTNRTSKSATFSGHYFNLTGVTEVGFEYKESSATTWMKEVLTVTSSPFDIQLTGLNESTEYQVRAYTVSDEGTVVGNEKTFVTETPMVTTLPVTNLSAFGATLHGSFAHLWNNTETGFEYVLATEADFTSATSVAAGLSSPFSVDLSGLAKRNEYKYRAYADHDGARIYGVTMMFEPVPVYCTGPSAPKANNDRGITRLRTSGATKNNIDVSIPLTTQLYRNYTSSAVIQAFPGDQITFTIERTGIWMHTYLYIDWNEDGTFAYENSVGPDGKHIPGIANSDVIAYSFYRGSGTTPSGNGQGYDSEGVEQEGSHYPTSFVYTIPNDAPFGSTRFRIKSDWNNLYPCGDVSANNHIINNRGNIFDFGIEILNPQATVSVESSDITLGTVAITTPATDQLTITTEEAVVVEATPLAGNRFVNWTDKATGTVMSTDAVYMVTRGLSIALQANFEVIPSYTFTYSWTPLEGGTVTAIDINTGDPIATGANLLEGTQIRLTATLAESSKGVTWSTGGSALTIDITLSNLNKDIVCSFVPRTIYEVSVRIEPTGAGTVTGTVGNFYEGSGLFIDLTATANEGYQFKSWIFETDVIGANPVFHDNEEGVQWLIDANYEFVAEFVAVSTSLGGTSAESTVSVFTVNNRLRVENGAGAQLQVRDILGKLLYSSTLSSSTQEIDLPIGSGVYLVSIKEANGIESVVKIVK